MNNDDTRTYLLQIQDDGVQKPHPTSRALYHIEQGFRPFVWLCLLSFRAKPMQGVPFATLALRVNTFQQLRVLHAVQSLGTSFNDVISYLFTPMFLVSLMRDVASYAAPDNRYDFAPGFPLWPTQFSDTFWTGSTTSLDQLAWRGYAIALWAPMIWATLRGVMSYHELVHTPDQITSTAGLSKLANRYNRLLRKENVLVSRLRYLYGLTSIGNILIYMNNLTTEQRKAAFEELQRAVNLQGEIFVQNCARSLLYEFIHQRSTLAQDDQDAELITHARNLIRRPANSNNVESWLANNWKWRLEPTWRSARAPLYAATTLIGAYTSCLYTWLLVSSWIQQIQLWQAEARCDQHFDYVYSRANYECSACPDWQHEVNTADLDDIQACVQARLKHPHDAATYRSALERGARLAPANTSWQLDLTHLPWETYDATEWQQLQLGLQRLVERHTLDSLNISSLEATPMGMPAKLGWLAAQAQTTLDLSNQHLTSELVEALHFAPTLQQLSLANTQLIDNRTITLFQRLNQTELQHLDLTGANFSEQAVETFLRLVNQIQLKNLVLTNAAFQAESGASFLWSLSANKLSSLDLSNVAFTEAMLPPLGAVLANGLTTLKLNNLMFSFSSITPGQFASVLCNSTLVNLELGFWELNSNVIQTLLNGSLHDSLRSLHLDDCTLADGTLDDLTAVYPYDTLEHLSLKRASVPEEELQRFISMMKGSALRKLDLSSLSTTVNEWQSIGDALLGESGSEDFALVIRDMQLTTDDFHDLLASNLSISRRFSLDLSDNFVDGASVPALAALVKNHRVVSLRLDNNLFSDRDWIALAPSLPNSHLRELSAYAAGLEPQGLRALSAHIAHAPLEHLEIGGNNLDSSSIEALIYALYDERLPHSEQLTRQAPSIDWRRHLSHVPLETRNFTLGVRNANLTDAEGRALCMAQVGFFSQGAHLSLALEGNHFDQVDASSCGVRNGAMQPSAHFALALVLLHLLWQGCSLLRACLGDATPKTTKKMPHTHSPRLA